MNFWKYETNLDCLLDKAYRPKDCQHLFDNSDEFCFSHCGSYTGYRHEYPLSACIESLTEANKKWVKKIILNHVLIFF